MNKNSWPQFLIGKHKRMLNHNELQKQIQKSSLQDLKDVIKNDQIEKKSLDSLNELDILQFEEFYRLSKQENYIEQKYENFKPLSDEQVTNKRDLKNTEELKQIGLQQIAEGNCGLILLAGGDGRRLGFDDPKILYDVDLQDSKTLIEVFINRVKSLQQVAIKQYTQNKLDRDCVIIYLIIQHSKQDQIKKFFEENQYFGYKTIVFVQTEQDINLFDENGNVVFDQNKKVLKSSMGNGDLISALNCSILDHMDKHGIKYTQISGIDNLLFRPLDPIFLGFTIFNKFQMVSKTVEKKDPKEDVGIHGVNSSGYNVYEYIHMGMDKRSIKNDDGSLYFKYAHLLNLIATKEALQQMCIHQEDFKIYNFVERPFDIYDLKQNKLLRDKKCSKVEWFFMDYYQFVKNQGFLNVEREVEFQAIKSQQGMNTPQQAKRALEDYYSEIQKQLGMKDKVKYLPEKYFYDIEKQRKWLEKNIKKQLKFKLISINLSILKCILSWITKHS